MRCTQIVLVPRTLGPIEGGLRRYANLAVIALLAACSYTEPFVDRAGHALPMSAASMETVRLNGVDQSVWFRGRDARAPALILLHGGPGASESALFRHFDGALENSFLVVYWEQRGTGRRITAAFRTRR